MISKGEVQCFLDQFNTKMKVFGIIYRDDRGKNRQTLEALEIVPMFRRVVIAEHPLSYPFKTVEE